MSKSEAIYVLLDYLVALERLSTSTMKLNGFLPPFVHKIPLRSYNIELHKGDVLTQARVYPATDTAFYKVMRKCHTERPQNLHMSLNHIMSLASHEIERRSGV
jgi:hypothetical protein